MDAAQVMFSVGDTTVAEEYNPGETSDLRLLTPLYVGGYDKQIITVPEDLLVKDGFHGCISMVRPPPPPPLPQIDQAEYTKKINML